MIRPSRDPFQTPFKQSFSMSQRHYPSLTLDCDNEVPLDAFDKQLLAESYQDRQEDDRLYRTTTPIPLHGMQIPKQNLAYEDTKVDTQYAFPTSSSTVSTSDSLLSPTLMALQNRQRKIDAPKLSSRPLRKDLLQQTASTLTQEDSTSGKFHALNHSRVQKLPVIQGIQLVPTTELPDQLRSIFPHPIFNAIQSKCFETAFRSDDNLVLSSPTGSGKTVVMELAICRLLITCKTQDFKIIYQAPTKSLCDERFRDWEKRLAPAGLQCAELTGDTQNVNMSNVQKAHVIITTPEKWDSVTRKWKDHERMMHMIKLFLVDEVHILRETRGATLEAVVSRMKSFGRQVRFVALSATVPNIKDIAKWLGRNGSNIGELAHQEVFGEEFRPVQLEKYVYGFDSNSNDFALDTVLLKHIPDCVRRHGKRKSTMVFCCTRKSAKRTASLLAEMWQTSPTSDKPWDTPGHKISVEDADLRSMAPSGVAFHHGGLSLHDRQTIEQAFREGHINVICSTSTLAVGINLPCYLVILQGTTCFGNFGLQEYSDLEVMQMLGRAGRPQYERSACAVILTRSNKTSKYEKMVSGEEVLESCLHQNLIEHLNAEIGLGTIYDTESAKRWLRSSFLYVRLLQNPDHYRFKEDVNSYDVETVVQQICEKDLELLINSDLITDGSRLTCTEYGDAMARYCINFESMKILLGLPPQAKISEILSTLAQATEFREVRMRSGEKSFYKELNKAPDIRFPIKVDVALQAHKVSLIMQAELGSVPLPEKDSSKKIQQQYQIDKMVVFNHANRLIRCIVDCQLHLHDALSARNALEFGRSLSARVWDNTASQLRQLPGLGEVAVRKLAAAQIRSIDTLSSTEPQRIEYVLGRGPPFGTKLLNTLSSFPNLRVSIKELSRQLTPGYGVKLKINADIGFINEKVSSHFNKNPVYVCFLAETSTGQIVDFRRCDGKKLQNGHDIPITIHLVKPTQYIRCHVMCDAIAGTSKHAQLDLGDIDQAIYPKQMASQNSIFSGEKDKIGEPVTVSSGTICNEGLEDDDFLAAIPNEGSIQVVQDIDELLRQDETKHQSDTLDKPKPSTSVTHSNDGQGRSREYRQPVKLANGRWSCQHDCNDKGVVCKHKCCNEGVLRPKRRTQESALCEEKPVKQRRLTSMTSMIEKQPPQRNKEMRDLEHLQNPTDNPISRTRDCEKKHVDAKGQHKPLQKSIQSSGHESAKMCDSETTKNNPNLMLDDVDEPLLAQSLALINADVQTSSPSQVFEPKEFEANDWIDQILNVNDFDENIVEAKRPSITPVPSLQRQDLDKELFDLRQGENDDCCTNFENEDTQPPYSHVRLADVQSSNMNNKNLHHENNILVAAASAYPTKSRNSTKNDTESVSCSVKPGKNNSTEVDDDEEDRGRCMRLSGDQVVPEPVQSDSMRYPGGSATIRKDGFQDTNNEESRHSSEEEQKRIWDEFDPWMYEAFHKIIEFV